MRRTAVALGLALALAAPAGATAAQSTQVLQGSHLFGRYCAACHGPNANGVRPAKSIGAGPGREQTQQRAVAPSLHGVGALAADFYLRTGYMPLQRLGLQPRRSRVILSETQIRALVAYVASLAPGPPIPHPQPKQGNLSEGEHLFADHCAGCHQIVGEGGYVTGAVPPPLEDATSRQIAEAVRIGPYVMPKFTTRDISDKDLNSIIAYVDYTKHPDDAGGWGIGHLGPFPEGMITWLLAIPLLLLICRLIGKKARR